MARPSEPQGGRLRGRAARLRAAGQRHRDCLLCALAVAGIGLATAAVLILGSRSLGPLLALGVLGLFTAERIEAL